MGGKKRNYHFETGALVWAKLPGYPYWPARIAPPIAQEIMGSPSKTVVLFFDETLLYGIVDNVKIEDFEYGFNKYNVIKSENFRLAVEMATENGIADPVLEITKNKQMKVYEVHQPIIAKIKQTNNCVAKIKNIDGLKYIKSEKEKMIYDNLKKLVMKYPIYSKNCEKTIAEVKKMTRKDIENNRIFKMLYVLSFKEFEVDPLQVNKRFKQIIENVLKNK